MKRIFTLMLIALCVTLLLAGCTQTPQANEPTEAPEPTEHVHTLVHNEAKAPTCVNNGISEHWYCPECNARFSDAGATTEVTFADLEIEELGHTAGEDDGDCTTAVDCTVCGKVATAAKPHTPAEDDGDCTTAVACAECDKIAVEAKSAHEAEEDDGNCTTAVKCAHCDVIIVEAKAAHTPNADDGDCTTAITCSVCGTVTTAANEHTPNADDGDCTTAITCSVCGEETTAAAAAHSFGNNEPACTVCGTVNPNYALPYKPQGMTDEELTAAWSAATFDETYDAVFIGMDFSSQGTIFALTKEAGESMATYITNTLDNSGKWNQLNRLNFYIGEGDDVSTYIPWNNHTLAAHTAYYSSLYLRKVGENYFLWWDGNVAFVGMGFKDGDLLALNWGATAASTNPVVHLVIKDQLSLNAVNTVAVGEQSGTVYAIPNTILNSLVKTSETQVYNGVTWTKVDGSKVGVISHTYCGLCAYLPILDTFTAPNGAYNQLVSEMGESVAIYVAEIDGNAYLWFKGLETIIPAQKNPHAYGALYWFDADNNFCMQSFNYTLVDHPVA